MNLEVEDEIIGRFDQALQGRFETLKPARAIERSIDFIAALRADYVPWTDIERLFNRALSARGKPELAYGSVARLYHLARGNTGSTGSGASLQAGSTPLPQAASAPESAIESTVTSTAAEVDAPGGPPDQVLTTADSATDRGSADPHLERIQARRRAKREMNQQ
ncbi:hypothetical protein [Devosia sp. RR2S18]|uniref:hypothetical protein n=1 Tax=Devosia rhizosphaerae TaxID=3049774 RepID=UPI002541180C|nr:hypothetical protein [Devosia sp. RR2S18]WIJ23996.1 hypothetical protein QOV41_13260 [Devosia sp. RR2S18]